MPGRRRLHKLTLDAVWVVQIVDREALRLWLKETLAVPSNFALLSATAR